MMLSIAAKRWVDWGLVLMWTLTIYLTIPVVRPFQKFVYRELGKASFTYFVLSVIGVSFVGVLIWLKTKHGESLSVRNYLWLLLVAGAYGFFTLQLNTSPEEAVHFLEYGFLSLLVFRALRHDVRDPTLYLSAAFVCLFLGTVDEIIQWVVPKRYWDFRDVWLNLLSGGLFQVSLWKGIRPMSIREKMRPKSVRILSVTVAGSVLLLGLCVSTTGRQMDVWAQAVPVLSSLKNNETMMSEFGYLHDDSALGVRFRSRMTKEKLDDIDAEKATAHARILNDAKDMKYGDFLRKYNPRTAPFLHEMRVHIFRRDRYESRGRKAEGGRRRAEGGRRKAEGGSRKSEGGERKELWTVAYKENLILEGYFGETLKKSGYAWSKERKREVAEVADKDTFYESPVSRELFTRFTKEAVWWGIAGVMVVLVAINMCVSKRLNREVNSGTLLSY